MTDREIMQQALDALKYHTEHTYPFHQTNVAMEALRQALAQPEQEQEPEIVRRVRRYAGKRRESVGSPHINAKECIALANWIDSVLAQPEFDTPESHIVKWSIPVDPNNFGEPLAQPEPFKPDWVSYRQGVADGAAQSEQEEPLPLVDIGVDVTPEGTHVVACYNRPDAVQEMFYSQFHPLAKPEQEPKLSDAGVDTNIPLWGLEPKGKGMLTFHQHNPEHQPWCDYLNIMLTSMPPQRANCNCKTAQPEPKSISTNDHLCAMLRQVHDVLACTALPMKRPWVGLTDEEFKFIASKYLLSREAGLGYFQEEIESKLKEKNNAV